MHQLIELYHSKQLHHAYFVVSHKTEEVLHKLKDFFEGVVGIKTSGNPDFYHRKFDNLTMDDARDITEASIRKSFLPNSPLRVFIIEADFISLEAQNSLLKVFEEPTLGTHFFIISPQDILLSTLRSRMHTIEFRSLDTEKFKSILDLKMKDRLEKVKEITDGISEAKSSNSSIARSFEEGFREEITKQDALSLLNQIERELYEKGVSKSAESLKICEQARASLYDRGAPIKMILENVMLNI